MDQERSVPVSWAAMSRTRSVHVPPAGRIDAHGQEDTPEAAALRERIGELFAHGKPAMN